MLIIKKKQKNKHSQIKTKQLIPHVRKDKFSVESKYRIRVTCKLERYLPTYVWTSWKWFSVELQDSPTPVSAIVSDLGWEPLQTRRLHGRLNICFSVSLEGRGPDARYVELLPECHPVPRHQPAARGHSQQFQRLQPSVDAYKYAFFPRTFPAWNAFLVELMEGRRRVIGGVQAASAVTPVTSPRRGIYCTNCFSALVPV